MTNATSATIDQGIGGVATPGSTTVKPTKTTTYTLTATGCGGTATKQVTVVVNQPTATFLLTAIVTIPPAQGDLILEDVFLSTNNDLILRVGKTGSLTGSFKYRVVALSTNVIVAQGSFAIPAGSQAFWTTYKPGGTVPVLVIIDPGNEIPETNEYNNLMTKTCYPASHTCQ